jgi:hypothetical protein
MLQQQSKNKHNRQKKKKTKKLLKTPQPFEMAAKTEYLACINWIII